MISSHITTELIPLIQNYESFISKRHNSWCKNNDNLNLWHKDAIQIILQEVVGLQSDQKIVVDFIWWNDFYQTNVVFIKKCSWFLLSRILGFLSIGMQITHLLQIKNIDTALLQLQIKKYVWYQNFEVNWSYFWTENYHLFNTQSYS